MRNNRDMHPAESTAILTAPGTFVAGCNYWASHAGTRMWSDWRPDIVAADLRQIAAGGMRVVRVFPLWPDFQPLVALRTAGGLVKSYQSGGMTVSGNGGPAPADAGVAEEALARFQHLADIARDQKLSLIVGLVTGWMSGQLFVPPALEGVNILADPEAILWQVRFVRCFVRRFKAHPAIRAWDLGNECNVMHPGITRAAAWTWTNAIASAIRIEDDTRPVISGMHGLSPAQDATWRIQDQAELTDVLTTHPYPPFTPHCDHDPIMTIRGCLHATAETRFYGDIGRRPALAEELGTLGPMIADDRTAAAYLRTQLFSLWAHDCRGLLWWCAYDQDRLAHPPYEWCACERELGLFRSSRQPKPVLAQFKAFQNWRATLPFTTLPPRIAEAVCILTEGQDAWGAAFSAFVLAKQAGFDLLFNHACHGLPDAPLYLLPSLSGLNNLPRGAWLDLLARVRAGATLYLSIGDGMLSPFNAPCGVQVRGRSRRTSPAIFAFDDQPTPGSISVSAPFRLELATAGAAVLAREPDGNPVLTMNRCGKGRIYCLGVPLETSLSSMPGAFHAPEADSYWHIYNRLATTIRTRRVVHKNHPMVGVTEHPVDSRHRVAVLINYSNHLATLPVEFKTGWDPGRILYGAPPSPRDGTVTIGPNDALVMRVDCHGRSGA